MPTSPISTDAVAATRAGDVLTLDWGGQGVANGTIAVRYMFDDRSIQTLATTIAGGVSVVPTTLARRHLIAVEQA